MGSTEFPRSIFYILYKAYIYRVYYIGRLWYKSETLYKPLHIHIDICIPVYLFILKPSPPIVSCIPSRLLPDAVLWTGKLANQLSSSAPLS